jgi:hypothetical protein
MSPTFTACAPIGIAGVAFAVGFGFAKTPQSNHTAINTATTTITMTQGRRSLGKDRIGSAPGADVEIDTQISLGML